VGIRELGWGRLSGFVQDGAEQGRSDDGGGFGGVFFGLWKHGDVVQFARENSEEEEKKRIPPRCEQADHKVRLQRTTSLREPESWRDEEKLVFSQSFGGRRYFKNGQLKSFRDFQLNMEEDDDEPS